MRIGVDSYSYHRLLGELRRGEPRAPGPPFARGSLDALAAMRAAGAEVASLETVFLPSPGRVDAGALRDAAGELELVLAWGHPDGLAWGADAAALSELRAWIRLAPRVGCTLVRIVAASPRLRRAGTLGEQLGGTARAVRRALDEAAAAGVALAIENHGDLTAAGLEQLLERCGAGGGVPSAVAPRRAEPGAAARAPSAAVRARPAVAAPAPGTLGVCLDTANALRVGDDPVAAARLLAPHVRMLHLKDCGPLAGRDPLAGPPSVPYGDGVVDLDGVLRALGPALDGLPVCVELAQLGPGPVDERELVADGVRWLRRWRACVGASAGPPADAAAGPPAAAAAGPPAAAAGPPADVSAGRAADAAAGRAADAAAVPVTPPHGAG